MLIHIYSAVVNADSNCICSTHPGVCQANDIDGTDASLITGWNLNNNSMEHHAKKPVHSHEPQAVKGGFNVLHLGSSNICLQMCPETFLKLSVISFPPFPGQEGDNCLRSSDCSEGLCCARHFWSRICKPVLTEGQVCTRHRRKGTHGLELFQRCDCGDGLACRPEKGERDHSVSRTVARNLHTCQRR